MATTAAILGTAVRAIATEVAARRSRDGLAPLIPVLASLSTDATARTPLTRTALPVVRSLAEWLNSARAGSGNAMSAPPSALESLIGLGPGLTPSGDDLLGGTLIALHALGWPDVAARLAAWLLARARGRTPSISLAHLACAAEGEGMAALHDVLAALHAPGSLGFRRGLDGLDAIGHTSGWDALVGAWVVAGAMAGARLSR